MEKVFIINPPDKFNSRVHISKDMAGGFGFNAGTGVILPPLDLIYHTITLRKFGYIINFYDFQAEFEKDEEFFEKIKVSDKCFVLILITNPTLDSDLKFIKKIKILNPKVNIFVKFDVKNEEIIKKIINTNLIEAVLVGETEIIIPQILDGKQKNGIVYKKNKKIIYGPKVIVENLDKLPDLELDFINISRYKYPLLANNNGNFFTFQSSRGCPFPCAYYCPYPLIQGNVWRGMSEKKLFKNVKKLVLEYNVSSIFFRDATFTLDKKRIIKFCDDVISEKLKFEWWCETRMNCLDELLLKKMSRAGCVGINLGVETGDDDLMKKQGKIGGDIKQLIKIRNLAFKFGIKLHFLMMVGLPEENKKSLYRSFKIIEKLKPESLGVTTITPYPGTDLYRDAINHNWIINNNLKDYTGNTVVMRSKYLTSKQIKHGNFLLKVAGYVNKQKLFVYKIINIFLKIYFWIWSKI